MQEAMTPFPSLNVLGQPLQTCGNDPVTGFYRNGQCDTCQGDSGSHTVCAIVTDSFLTYSKAQGNDLSTPHPEWQFPGLKAGDRWCVCAARWKQAYDDGMAPPVDLAATHQAALEIVPLPLLQELAWQPTV
jgi:uncharacterized protein (DUF2237 family)